ncbi:MAG: hypothetical protein ABIN58_13840, partial [candidate division WOR-3 bacterium]
MDRHDRGDSKSLQAGETPALPANGVISLPSSIALPILQELPSSLFASAITNPKNIAPSATT